MSSRLPRPFRLTAPQPREAELHRQILAALRLVLPQRALVVHVPNGMESSPAAWNRMRELGAVAGFPDLAILFDGACYLLEIKREAGRESDAQRALAVRLAAAMIPRAVVRDAGEAVRACDEWGLPLRQRRAFGLGAPATLTAEWPASLILEDWQRAAAEAVRTWQDLAVLAPVPLLRQERMGLESRLRQFEAEALTEPGVPEP